MIFPVLPMVIFFLLISWYEPGGVSWQTNWVPSLDVNLSFKLDGLSFLFACLISGIGALIQIYALAYLKGDSSRFSFHLYLTLFMLAMLGVVTSDNILLFFVFWELTTITSYLLIGFNHEKDKSRKNALQSLIVTGAGGLALLAGLILLGEMAGSYEISTIVAQSTLIAQHEWFLPSLVLVLLGTFTKSAQFPFHFWLPNAMAAPTPVSAYLHSATMVKAGVYLLARVSPIYSHNDIWFYTLGIFGGFTAIWCALLALKQTDLKLMLAYSTNVALGKLVLLIGMGTELAMMAALLFVLAHSFYKAALFMVVGNIDKATGTRDIRMLYGLKTALILSLVAAIIAALSKSGVPPLLGFLSKEYMYKSGLEVSVILTVIFLVVNVIMVALALALIVKPFFATYEGNPTPAKKVESSKGLWLPAILLAIASVLAPVLGLDWINNNVVIPGVLSSLPDSAPQAAKLWQGVNLPLVLSVLTLLLGFVLYRVYPRLLVGGQREGAVVPTAESVFDKIMAGMMRLAKWQTQLLQQKRLSYYVLLFYIVLAGLLLSSPLVIPRARFAALTDINFYEVSIALLLIAAALVCTFTKSRLLAVSALGVVGFMTTLVFMIYSAPDVAKTLLLVETLMVVFVVLLIRHIPGLMTVPQHPIRRKLLHAAIAGVIGISVTALLINITAQPLDATLADFFAENSVPGGHGRNIVNVILVDFRAFDTLGEVIVVVMAGIAAVSLLKTHYHKRNRIHSLIFATTAHIVSALMLVFSLYLLLRGHNEPGGGFIGALIAVIGFALLMFAESPKYIRDRLYFAPFSIALFGIFLSFVAGLMSFAFNLPFLTGLWWKDILPLGTPLIFDVGIYLAIIGGVMGMLLRVNEELD
ncbi:hydrogen gas-evolving membrane-bound hydrogenase subunit E [Vibrio celticus]|uniref:hydrogen gas-evolving membrane-bound hydrogenase subunit E n=1 Tax=Vibrio celticus TaxID=446372 RepID=UPI0040683A6A